MAEIEKIIRPKSYFSDIPIGGKFHFNEITYLKVDRLHAFNENDKVLEPLNEGDKVTSEAERAAEGMIPFASVKPGDIFFSSRWYFIKINNEEDIDNAFNLSLNRTTCFILSHEVKPAIKARVLLTVSDESNAG